MLTFDSGKLDYVTVPAPFAARVLAGSSLRPDYERRGIVLHRGVAPSVSYFFFNFEDPLLGGYSPERIALRRAISMGYNGDEAIRLLLDGQGITAMQPIPPPLYGHDPKYRAPYGYDPKTANALLDRFRYKDKDGDGYREMPDGKPLTIMLGSKTDSAARTSDELWKRNMDAIGIRIQFIKNKPSELERMSEAGQLMMGGGTWMTFDFPDGIDNYSYFYSRNVGTSNEARMRLPALDTLYEAAARLPDGPERTKVFSQMNDMIFNHVPWIFTSYPYQNVLVQPWVRGYKLNTLTLQQWRYYDVEAR